MTVKTLRIEPGLNPGEFKFLVDEKDISSMITSAEISFHPHSIPTVRLNIVSAIDIPDDLSVVLFTRESDNGNR